MLTPPLSLKIRLLFAKHRHTWMLLLAVLMLLSSLPGNASEAGLSVAADDTPTSGASQQAGLLCPGTGLTTPPHMHIRIMTSRYWDLVWTLAGRQQTGVPLVETCGKKLIPSAGGIDDVGSFYLIPELSLFFGLRIAQSVDLFYEFFLGFSLVAGAIAFLVLYRTWLARAVAVIGVLLLTAIGYKIGDVYIFCFVTAVVVTPWSLVWTHRTLEGIWPMAGLFVIGVLIETGNLVRSHAGTAALIFVCLILFFQASAGKRQKVALLLCLIAGMLVPRLVISRAIGQSDTLLSSRDPGFKASSREHVLWHSVYSGLGFLQNDYGFKWDDAATYEKAQSVMPGVRFGSPQYEQILKREVIRAVWHHPWFIFETLSAKLGITFAVIVLFANVGILAAVASPKPWAVEISFWAAILFNSLFGLVAIPVVPYMLGLISYAGLYGVVSLCFFLEKRSTKGHCRLN